MHFFRVNHTVRHLGWFLLASYGTWDFALKFKCDDTKELKHSRDIVILYLIFICFEGELWLSVFIKLFMLSEGTSKVQISEVSKLISWIYATNPIKFEMVTVSSIFFRNFIFCKHCLKDQKQVCTSNQSKERGSPSPLFSCQFRLSKNCTGKMSFKNKTMKKFIWGKMRT